MEALSRLGRRRRAAARHALYASLAVVVLVMAVLLPVLRRAPRMGELEDWARHDFPSRPAVRLLQEYIRIDTSRTTGGELAGARFLAERLAEAGVEAHVERLGDRHANLWAVIEGDDPRALVLHHHIDVAPAGDPAAWSYPPYAAEIDPPWLFGRGAFDMKSVAVAHLQAFLDLARSGRRPERSVILLATGSEEAGSDLGVRWILRRHPDLVDRFWAVLTEGGVVEAVGPEQIKYWGIEFAQKRFASAAACSHRRDRLEALFDDVLRTGRRGTRLRAAPEVRRFLASYAASRDRPLYRDLLADLPRLVHDRVRFQRLPPFLQSMFRDELVPFELEELPGGGWRLPMVFHLLPGSELAGVRDELLPAWATHGVAVSVSPPLGATGGSPLDHPLFEELAAALRRRHPEAHVGPYFLPWSATDARFFRAAGIPAYGFSPFVILSTDTYPVDDRNERIGLPGFVTGVELFREILPALVGTDRPPAR